MPPVAEHVKASLARTGKEYREVHEWLDNDAEKKAERHDIARIPEFGKMLEEKYGKEGFMEYVHHLHADMKAKFEHIQREIEKTMKETMSYFGIK